MEILCAHPFFFFLKKRGELEERNLGGSDSVMQWGNAGALSHFDVVLVFVLTWRMRTEACGRWSLHQNASSCALVTRQVLRTIEASVSNHQALEMLEEFHHTAHSRCWDLRVHTESLH